MLRSRWQAPGNGYSSLFSWAGSSWSVWASGIGELSKETQSRHLHWKCWISRLAMECARFSRLWDWPSAKIVLRFLYFFLGSWWNCRLLSLAWNTSSPSLNWRQFAHIAGATLSAKNWTQFKGCKSSKLRLKYYLYSGLLRIWFTSWKFCRAILVSNSFFPHNYNQTSSLFG